MSPPEELGGADVHTRTSGVADHYAEDDEHALELVRDIVATLNRTKRIDQNVIEPEAPLYRAEVPLWHHSRIIPRNL